MDESYDALAGSYDSHFDRPVDHWEDERLAKILRPIVNDKRVLDLGCGTGWLLDHCEPGYYVGVDSSVLMLDELVRKHPVGVGAVKAEVGAPHWDLQLPIGSAGRFDAVTATWALQYLYDGPGSLQSLLMQCATLVRKGGTIALHGYLPRYRYRRHYIGWPHHVPPVVHQLDPYHATVGTGLTGPRLVGCGALPDSLAQSRWLWWKALYLVPPGWHYSGIWIWSR